MSKKRSSAEIPIRHRHYPYDQSIPKYYDSGNVVLTSEWEALSLVTGPGERYFVRSVQRLASRTQDPLLKKQIKGFIGQETVHTQEYDRFLEVLRKRGFPVEEFHQWFDGKLHWLEKHLYFLPRIHLAGTAAAEHLTSTLLGWMLRTHYYDRFPPSLRELWRWHSAEELEHKAVAYDLLQDVAPRNYLLRIMGFAIGISVVGMGMRRAEKMLLQFSGLSKKQLREERKKARKIRIPLFSFRIPNFLKYFLPGFHPCDLDDGTLSAKTLSEQAMPAKAG